MNQFTLLIAGISGLVFGSILGYYTRQSIAKKKAGTIEQTLQKRLQKAKEAANLILSEAKEKSQKILIAAEEETKQRHSELLKTERLLLKREHILDQKISDFEFKQKEFQRKVEKLRQIKENLEDLKIKALENLERISGLTSEEAKKELLENVEKEYQKEILEKIKKLEKEGKEKFEKRAKEILATAIQKCAISQAQEITTTTFSLPSEEIKGRIIGKEGRNIRTLEKLTGVEIVVDETPEIVVISGFDPIRRQIAKLALEKLVQDGRIQPARIEEKVEEAKREISNQIQEAGETAIYEMGLLGVEPKLVQLLGRLKFRTSYGQNVLLHSIEVAYLAEALAEEIGANSMVCKKAGLFHDIGKAVDQQIEGSHTDIGIKILEKFGQEPEVIQAMKSHHEEYPYESLEAIIVQVADQISGARPGARKDTLENYLKRLSDLENLATSFFGVEKAWALQAGREIRVFVRPEEIDDLGAKKLARDIANKIQEELKYPGEIKVNVVREMRITEYAR
ncbi:MAG: ribonuclease Y [Patescibacteria group bacterium]|nr:ribonuclease Y [Patescibacteria group bacterium]